MQLGHKLRYLAGWTCTITCSFLLFCDALFLREGYCLRLFWPRKITRFAMHTKCVKHAFWRCFPRDFRAFCTKVPRGTVAA